MADDESRPVRPDGRVWKRRTMMRLFIVLLIAGLMFLGVLPFQMCRDWALVCETTGSHQGYRQWFTGHRTGQWYEKSHLEEFMEQQYPAELEHRWVSYSGTGRNILGQAILFGHGRPNDTLILYRPALDRYVDGLDNEGKRTFYHELTSGAPDEIDIRMQRIIETNVSRAALVRPPQ